MLLDVWRRLDDTDQFSPMANEGPLPNALTVGQLHEGMRAAFTAAGLGQVWVTGVVTGLRRGPRFSSWELVEYGDDAAEVRAVLSVGAFPREMADIDTVLDGAGLELAEGAWRSACAGAWTRIPRSGDCDSSPTE